MKDELSAHIESIATEIVDIAFKIHNELGPGLLESVYEKCFCYELDKRGIPYKRQPHVAILYDGQLIIADGLRADLLVVNSIIVELKAQENTHPVWEAQLLSYLKLTNKRLGFLINFHVVLIKKGIRRIIL